jgi:hypothetical protein
MTLYVVMIEYTEGETSYIQTHWASADSIGNAIDAVVAEGKINGIQCPIPRQIDPYDISNLPDEGISRGENESVMFSETVHSFPADDVMINLPYGIIPSCIEGEFDYSEILSGYTRTKLDGNLHKISMIVSDDDILTAYMNLLEREREYKVLMIELHSHYQNDKINEIYTNEKLATFQNICDFITGNSNDIIKNGHVGVVSYLDKGKTNIKLSDHKMIEIIGYDSNVIEQYGHLINTMGFPYLDRFVSINDRMHHWHYRPAASKNKSELTNHITGLGFNLWKRKVG